MLQPTQLCTTKGPTRGSRGETNRLHAASHRVRQRTEILHPTLGRRAQPAEVRLRVLPADLVLGLKQRHATVSFGKGGPLDESRTALIADANSSTTCPLPWTILPPTHRTCFPVLNPPHPLTQGSSHHGHEVVQPPLAHGSINCWPCNKDPPPPPPPPTWTMRSSSCFLPKVCCWWARWARVANMARWCL